MNIKLVLTAGAFALAAGTQAFAADLPVAPPRAPAAYVAAPPPFTWTAFYIGGNLGAGWNHGDISDNRRQHLGPR